MYHTGVLRVTLAHYRPAAVQVRVDLDPYLATVQFLLADIDMIRQDPNVAELTLSQPIPLQRLP